MPKKEQMEKQEVENELGKLLEATLRWEDELNQIPIY